MIYNNDGRLSFYRYPTRVVVDGDGEDGPSTTAISKEPDDFFDESNWGWDATSAQQKQSAIRSTSAASSSPTPSFASNRSTTAPPSIATATHITAIASETNTKSPVDGPSSAAVSMMLSSTTAGASLTSSSRSKKGGKLGVKKVAVSFDEMENKAKLEGARREEMAKQGLLELEKESEKSNQDKPSNG
jgi:hypothetical protein